MQTIILKFHKIFTLEFGLPWKMLLCPGLKFSPAGWKRRMSDRKLDSKTGGSVRKHMVHWAKHRDRDLSSHLFTHIRPSI